MSFMPFLVDDAKSYFTLIKSNRLKTEAEDQEAISVIEDQLVTRIQAANGDGRTGYSRDAYMFFQGALMGHLIEAKKYVQNLKVQASEQHVELEDPDASTH